MTDWIVLFIYLLFLVWFFRKLDLTEPENPAEL